MDRNDSSKNDNRTSLVDLIDDDDVFEIMKCQRNMLSRFEKTNEMLVNCNHLAAIRLEKATRDMKAHSHTLEELKKDLDNVFRRIRILKNRLSHEYPQAFKACAIAHPLTEDDQEDDVQMEKSSSQP